MAHPISHDKKASQAFGVDGDRERRSRRHGG